MTKAAYIGINSVARKIKKMYIGVNGVARKVKKAYIGVNGVARLFWSADELTYKGTNPTSYGVGCQQLAGTCLETLDSTNNPPPLAIFTGGKNNSSVYNYARSWNTSGTYKALTNLSYSRRGHAGASNSAISAFYGGISMASEPAKDTDSSYYRSYIETYNPTTGTKLSNYRSPVYEINSGEYLGTLYPSGIGAGDYLYFLGGYWTHYYYTAFQFSEVVMFNKSTMSLIDRSGLKYSQMAHGKVGMLCIWAGGRSWPGSTNLYNTIKFIEYGTITPTDTVGTSFCNGAIAEASSWNDIGILAGGFTNTTETAVTNQGYVLDGSDGTWIRTANLKVARGGLKGYNVGGKFAVFVGGKTASGYSNAVDVYDEKGTRIDTYTFTLSHTGYNGAAARAGSYTYFVGGYNGSYYANVDQFYYG